MKFSDGEKLILVMLADLYKHLKIQHSEINPELVLSSVFRDKTWGLKWEYGSLFNADEENPPVVQETVDILDMYRWIASSFEKLSAMDKDRVKKESSPYAEMVRFQGFDGNNDEHFGVVDYLVRDLKRYDELKGVGLNSHSIGTLPKYRKMLSAYEPMTEKPSFSQDGLSADQIIEILKA